MFNQMASFELGGNSKSIVSNTTSSSFSGCFSIGHTSVFLESPSQDINPEEDFYATFPEKLAPTTEPFYKRQSSCDKLLEDLLNLEDSTKNGTFQILPPVLEDTKLCIFDHQQTTKATLVEKSEFHYNDCMKIKTIEASLKQEVEVSSTISQPLTSFESQDSLIPDLSSPCLDEKSVAGETFQDLSLLLEQKEPVGILPPGPKYLHSENGSDFRGSCSSFSSQDDSCGYDIASLSSCGNAKRSASSLDPFDDDMESMDVKHPRSIVNTTTALTMRTDATGVVETGRYKEMRKKNNIASKRSRQTRKEKEREMEALEKKLMEENASLKVTVKNLEEITNELKQRLIQTIVKTK